MDYRRLTREERYQIEALRRSGLGIRKIGEVLDRSGSTICRELKRNQEKEKIYGARRAQKKARGRREGIHPPLKMKGKLRAMVVRRLRKQWSPEQISQTLRREGIKISHETVYQWIYRNRQEGGEFWKQLRRKRKWRWRREVARKMKNCGTQKSACLIEQRPEVVLKRERLGDFERDTLVGKRPGPVLLTIVDRVSRLTKIAKVGRIDAQLTHQATLKKLKGLPIKTITNDNGTEFRLHEKTSRVLQIPIYFNHPYSAWERGTNENTNGLLRQYYPKGFDFRQVSSRDLQTVERLLNTRPRKCLGYRTPLEVQKQLSRTVALST